MRAAALFVAVGLLVSCGGDDSSGPAATVVDRTRAVPDDVRAFLDRIADDDTLTVDATYHVLVKLGGEEHDVVVHADAGALTIEVDGEPVDVDDDARLASYGLVAGFMTSGPAKAIEAAARRVDADSARFSHEGDLDCIEIPVQTISTSKWCLTAAGIFGRVETPAVRYELTNES